MRWLLIFGILTLLVLVVLQQEKIAGLQDDATYTEVYVASLEEQARALHENVILQNQKVRNVSQELSEVTAERNAYILREDNITLAGPQKRVDISDVVISEDAAMINIEELTPGIIAPSGSMFPLLQKDTIVLEKAPEDFNELLPGDIIIFTYKDTRIIHRIVSVGWDEEGWYANTKGDNNPLADPFKVRFADVKGVVVGIIY